MRLVFTSRRERRTGRSPFGGLFRPFALVLPLALSVACATGGQVTVRPSADRLAGVVRNEQREPVQGASVTAENVYAAPHLFTAVTDEKGEFVFVGVPVGAWNIAAHAPGYMLSQAQVTLSRREPARPVEFVLARGPWARPREGRAPTLRTMDAVRLQTSLRNADTLAAAHQYEQALAEYRDVLRRAPALTLVNLQIGHVLRLQKDYPGALSAYRQVLAVEADNELAMEAIGATELERGRLDAAEEVLTRAANRPRPGRATLCSLGDVEAARGQAVAAAEWYRRAAEADPRWVKPVLKLALLAAQGQDREAAIALLEKALRMAPGSPEAEEAARALTELRNR